MTPNELKRQASDLGRERAAEARDLQIEKMEEDEDPTETLIQQMDFQGVETIGHLIDIAFARSGDLIFKIRVPFRFAEKAVELRKAWNVPLDIRIETWQLYRDFREGQHGG